MSVAVQRSDGIPVIIEGVKYGSVKPRQSDGILEYVTFRPFNRLYRNTPCRLCEEGRCLGFTVSKIALDDAKQKGAVFVKIIFEASKNQREIYVTSISRLEQAAVTQDNNRRAQFSMPLHEWVKLQP